MVRVNELIIDVEPKVLKWVIDTSGWSNDAIIKKMKIEQSILDGWLKGEIKPTLKQLEDLSIIVKRPLATFFLSKPLEEKPLPKDYRMLPKKEGIFDKKTILAIRRARRVQKISKELSENIDSILEPKIYTITRNDNPKYVAEKYRSEFKITEGAQKKWKTATEAFNNLRDLIEDRNIIVLQISMPIDDARGFALVDDIPAVIVVNSKDIPEAKIFTLMHEFGHVLLKESGISMPELSLFIKNVDKVEKWCNEFAASFLLPESMSRDIFVSNKDVLTETKTLNSLSSKYKVSKAMLLYNMFKLNFISKGKYDSVIDRYKPIILEVKVRRGGSGITQDKRCITEKGEKFVSLVADNIEKGYITHSEALDYLSIKSQNLDKVTSRIKK
jgi:Zn-dependent peptidase ImmA (M78 family)